VVAWRAGQQVVAPVDADWPTVTAALAAKRLNAEGGAPMIERWARESTVIRLSPTGEVTEWPDHPAGASLARPPRPTDATTLGRQPLMIRGLRRRSPR
jgi:hypothetical protein